MTAQLQPGLTWGIKTSFLKYVFSTEGGSHSATGVTLDDDGRYVWPFESIATADDIITVQFSGTLRLTGHSGAISLVLRNPAITVSTSGSALSIEDPDMPSERLTLAGLDAPSAIESPEFGWRDIPARLSSAGAMLFNSVYPVGEQLEPVSVRIDSSQRSAPHAH